MGSCNFHIAKMEANERLTDGSKLTAEPNQLLNSLQARLSSHQLNRNEQASNTNLKEQANRRKTNLAKHMIDKKHKKSDGDILKTDEPNNTSDSTQHQTSRKTRIGNRVSVFRNEPTGPPGTYTRRVSNFGATGPLAGRNSVNVRKTSVVLTKFDEGMPIGGSRRVSQYSNTITPGSQYPPGRASHMSRRSIIPMDGIGVIDHKPWTIEDPDRRESKNNKVNSVARKISTNIKQTMLSKEEENMRRVGRLLWLFWSLSIILTVLTIIFNVYLDNSFLWLRILNAVLLLLVVMTAWVIPRKVLSDSFVKSLEKTRRFQNLQNVFIQKEIRDFNKELECSAYV